MYQDALSAQKVAPGVELTIGLAAGVGEGPTTLAAFDSALRHAGVANFNLIRLSSVIPPASRLDIRTDGGPLAAGTWGQRLYVVMAEQRVDEPGDEAWAGIGWVQDETGKGLFVEHEGHSRDAVEGDIEASLASMVAGRPTRFGPVGMLVEGTTCVDRPACALVVAAFEAEPWGAGVIDLDGGQAVTAAP